MSTDFAAIQARAGAAIVRRLANASMTVTGLADPIDGNFSRVPFAAALGGAGTKAHNVWFTFLAADLGATALDAGTAVAIGGIDYLVADRTDDVEGSGQTVLELELA